MQRILKYAQVATIIAIISIANVDAEPSKEQKIIDTVEALFQAVSKKDKDAVRELLAHNSAAFAISMDEKDGPAESGNTSLTKGELDVDFIHNTLSIGGEFEAVLENPEVIVKQRIASVWADYRMRWRSEPYFCGKVLFALYEEQGIWRVTNATFASYYETGCAAA